MDMKLSNIGATLNDYRSGACVHWETDDARYHVWLRGDDLKTIETAMGKRRSHATGTIYKNAKAESGTRRERTQYLDAGAKANAAMLREVFEFVDLNSLWDKARQAVDERQAAKELEYDARFRERAIAEAAPAMYDALLKIAEACESVNFGHAGDVHVAKVARDALPNVIRSREKTKGASDGPQISE